MTKNEIALMGKIYLIFNASQFLWDTSGSVHKVTISKYFAKYVGSTVLLYQRKIRMIRAMELIHSNEYSLTEVAFLCGFSDQSHFTRYFRQMFGFLPKYLQKLSANIILF